MDPSTCLHTPPPDNAHTPSAMFRDTRRVRFALDNEASPISTSSTLSSPGPHTPQQFYQPLVHVHSYSQSSSPSFSPNHLALTVASSIHGVLEVPSFDFDISLDPHTNPAMRDNLHLQRILNDPATHPPLPSLTFVSSHLPWEINISRTSQPYVTISDVLGGLYRALRTCATQGELSREAEVKRAAILRAHMRRSERHLPNDRRTMERERSKGPRRIDFLAGNHYFRGLVKTERPNVWYIQLRQ